MTFSECQPHSPEREKTQCVPDLRTQHVHSPSRSMGENSLLTLGGARRESNRPHRNHILSATHCTALAASEKTLLALDPMSRVVPTTITRMTANITAYSAMSWPSS